MAHWIRGNFARLKDLLFLDSCLVMAEQEAHSPQSLGVAYLEGSHRP
jgi:hypothetical protein